MERSIEQKFQDVMGELWEFLCLLKLEQKDLFEALA